MKDSRKLIKVKKLLVLVLLLLTSSLVGAKTIVYGFDGTGKNYDFGDKTNVTNFLEAHAPYGGGYYINGVGSKYKKWKFLGKGKDLSNWNDLAGFVGGAGYKKALEKMYGQLVTNFKNGDTGIVIVGFSRGAALSREFAHMIHRRGDPKRYQKGKKPKGKAPTIQFMGLFDTVYSFGNPFGKRDLGFSKWIPSNVKAVAHATAELEKRNHFDLWSIHPKKEDLNDKTGTVAKGNYRHEREFEGGHNDIGGAEKNNHYGYKPLKWVIERGKLAGVRLDLPDENDFKKVAGQEPNGEGKGRRQIYFPKIPAKKYKKAKRGCEGKQVYLSGTKCYECPSGYKRKSLTRKMTHPEACEKRGMGFNKKKKSAKYVWGANGCPKHQFKHKGYCKKCPKGTKRIHVAGIDTGTCKLRD
jgi:hypothetical protein